MHVEMASDFFTNLKRRKDARSNQQVSKGDMIEIVFIPSILKAAQMSTIADLGSHWDSSNVVE